MPIRFYTPSGKAVSGGALAADYAAAEKAGAGRVGKIAFYYRDGLRVCAVPLEDIRSAELRERSRFAKCGCGCLEFKGLSLDISGEDGLIASIFSEDGEKLASALDALRPCLGGPAAG